MRPITIVLLIHRRAAYWTHSSDYEFSRYSMEEHWLAGTRTSNALSTIPTGRIAHVQKRA